jgi:hypothetical protein
MNGLLVRIGVDHSYGKWNAPVDPVSGRFIYLPIPENAGTGFHPDLERRYEEFVPSLKSFCTDHRRCLHNDLRFPAQLLDCSVHLDPDFRHLTYGDDGARRGTAMKDMAHGDFLAFYAGLRPISPCEHKLVYALIGLYLVDTVIPVASVPQDRWHQNAHTRKSKRGATDIVVTAQRGRSGRLEGCLPIGEWRNGAYRVTQEMLDAWGGLSVKDGYIQRSIVPPRFTDPARFLAWFEHQRGVLVERNN